MRIAKLEKNIFNVSKIVSKCICENKNGGGTRGYWLCENDGFFVRADGCYKNEWCVGPHNKIDATFAHETLCMKGRLFFCIS